MFAPAYQPHGCPGTGTGGATPSVTIALNQIIYGQAWTEKSIAYVSPYEHNSVLRPLDVLSKKIGFQVLELPLAEDLSIDLAKTAAMFEENPPSFVAGNGGIQCNGLYPAPPGDLPPGPPIRCF